MVMTPDAHRWLLHYVEQARASGLPHRATAKAAVALTVRQHAQLEARLKAYWGAHYACPAVLDLKPEHGYRSRVDKDGFTPDDYVEWLVAGCSDVADVATQPNGRPYLFVCDVHDGWDRPFDLIVPITSDHFGYVHVFDVIPKGLPARRHKKTAPSALP